MAWQTSKRVKTKEFVRNRDKCRNRDRGICVFCEVVEGRLTPAAECDHIVNQANGGTDDLWNLQMLCKEHHADKTQRESNGLTGFSENVDWKTGWNIPLPDFQEIARSRTSEYAIKRGFSVS